MLNVQHLKCEGKEQNLSVSNPNPHFSWSYPDMSGAETVWAYVEVTDFAGNLLWRSPGEADSFRVRYGGKPLESGQRYRWRVAAAEGGREPAYSGWTFFDTVPADFSDGKAKWISLNPRHTETCLVTDYYTGCASPYFSREFFLDRKLRRAVLYLSACGIYEFLVNGKRTEPVYFSPGWTDYRKRIQYQAYDITGFLRDGTNTLTVSLGDGWYRGYINSAYRLYGDIPLKLFARLLLEDETGAGSWICSDESWKSGTGPVRYSDLQMGELYDARLEPADWSKADPGFYRYPADAEEDAALTNLLSPQESEYIRAVEEISIASAGKAKDGTIVLDIGQNIAGFLRTAFRNLRNGQVVQIRYGEMLNPDGSVYLNNLRTARQCDTYIARGDKQESYTPHFTSHGFQFAEICGLDDHQFSLEDTAAVFVSTDCPVTGSFETSHEGLNALYSNILRSQRGNFHSVPTDCPQRDERLGWTGDAQIFCKSACYNMDCGNYYRKYVQDIREAQRPSGGYTDIAPVLRILEDVLGEGNAAWGDAGVVIPWTLYLFYGDREILENGFESMKRHCLHLVRTSRDYVGKNSGYGDWLNVGDETPREVMSTAYCAYVCTLMGKIAAVLGDPLEEAVWKHHAAKFRDAFCSHFVGADGTIAGDSQTAYVLALHFGLLDPMRESLAFGHLIRRLEQADWHLSTGFVGVSYLLPVLTEHGRSDLAYRLLLNESYPSWLYSVKNGATSVWERWDSYTLEGGFKHEDMNSFNHYSLGSVAEWLFSHCCGIMPDESKPGFRRFYLRPNPSTLLPFAAAEYRSACGKIVSRWTTLEDGFRIEAEVPPNTTAVFRIPVRDGEEWFAQNGKPLPEPSGGHTQLLLHGGCYEFISRCRVPVHTHII